MVVVCIVVQTIRLKGIGLLIVKCFTPMILRRKWDCFIYISQTYKVSYSQV